METGGSLLKGDRKKGKQSNREQKEVEGRKVIRIRKAV